MLFDHFCKIRIKELLTSNSLISISEKKKANGRLGTRIVKGRQDGKYKKENWKTSLEEAIDTLINFFSVT